MIFEYKLRHLLARVRYICHTKWLDTHPIAILKMWNELILFQCNCSICVLNDLYSLFERGEASASTLHGEMYFVVSAKSL